MNASDTLCVQAGCGCPPHDAGVALQPNVAFVELLEPSLQRLKRFVARALNYGPDVDDILQQTLLKAFTHMDQFRFQASFVTWLRSIALNEIRQLHRARPDVQTVDAFDLNPVDRRESAQTICERRQTAQAVYGAIRRLPPKYQAVIVLRYLRELNVAEVATRLSISLSAVKIRLHRARRLLACELGGLGAIGEPQPHRGSDPITACHRRSRR